ncbi:hypothetical protein PMI25_002429 [Pseudomonas sp. GM30]|nr:hypothetical protein PMI25_002429 [Pseudomonas sp. GM30]
MYDREQRKTLIHAGIKHCLSALSHPELAISNFLH